MRNVFGRNLTPKQTALIYFAGKKNEKAVDIETTWPAKWGKFLLKLATTDPFEAKVGRSLEQAEGQGQVIQGDSNIQAISLGQALLEKRKN